MSILELFLGSGQHVLEVRHFNVEEAASTLFRATVMARSTQEDIDLDSIVGQPAALRVVSGTSFALNGARLWSGVCIAMEQTRAEPMGLSTYELTIAPSLWLLTQRRNNRLFQHVSIPDIVDVILKEWQIEPIWSIDRPAYPRLELRAQYGESDHAFLCRLLEEAGISYFFEDHVEKGSLLRLDDHPHNGDHRAGGPLPFVESPGQAQAAELDFLTQVRVGHEVSPGRFTVRDFDFRNPAYPLFAESAPTNTTDDRYEHYHYRPGASLVEAPRAALAEAGRVSRALADAVRSEATPVCDDKAVARFDFDHGRRRAQVMSEAGRGSRRAVAFRTSAIDLRPGTILSMIGHPRSDLLPTKRLLTTHFTIEGAPGEEWHMRGTAVFADQPYRAPQITSKPVIHGVQSAIVVGPPGEEIYTDEFGRVRVQFHWDREHAMNDESSIWLRVSQGWAGGGFGMFTVPRVGHEVLVGFLDGDPDSPIVVGRVFNGASTVPYPLPQNKTVSTWKSSSSPEAADGFNELRFDDARGREHLYVQAQKDMDTLVKHDQMCAVGNDRRGVVQHDDSIAVGHDRTKVVHFNEIEVTGMNRTATVGVNRNTTVGVDDSTLVGSKYSVTMARGLTAKLAQELGTLMTGPLGSVLSGPIQQVLGMIPQTPLGGGGDLLAAMARGPLSLLSRVAPDTFRSVLDVMEGFVTDHGPPPTTFEMVDRKITLSTGEASIVLDGPNITFFAEGNIMLHAQKNVGVLADNEAALSATDRVLVHARKNEVIVQGRLVSLNPFDGTQDRLDRVEHADLHDPGCQVCGEKMVMTTAGPMCSKIPVGEEPCALCGGPMVELGGMMVCGKMVDAAEGVPCGVCGDVMVETEDGYMCPRIVNLEDDEPSNQDGRE